MTYDIYHFAALSDDRCRKILRLEQSNALELIVKIWSKHSSWKQIFLLGRISSCSIRITHELAISRLATVRLRYSTKVWAFIAETWGRVSQCPFDDLRS